jgi:hypothetical protein
MYFVQTDPWASSQDMEVSAPLASMPIGIVYPQGSTLRAELDKAFLKLFETPLLRDYQARWFAPPAEGASSMHVVQWELAGPAFGLIGLCPRPPGAVRRPQRFPM